MLSPEQKKWLGQAFKTNHEGMVDSIMFLGFGSEEWLEDPLCCLQLGIAIMLDKPIVLLAVDGIKLSDNLKRVARHIEYQKKGESIESASQRLMVWAKENIK